MSFKRNRLLIAAVLLLSGGLWASGSVFAAPKAPAAKGAAKKGKDAAASESTALRPEVLGAKAFLEELLVRRYSQDLSTAVDRQSFNLGAQLELAEAPKPKEDAPAPEDDTPSDLVLGTLDPEELLRKYGGSEGSLEARGFLKNYRIQSVSLSVGLKDSISAESKTQVEKWLSERVNAEFGKAGKSTVSYIQGPVEKKTPPVEKTFLDWLAQFQGLAGQLALALAIVLGTLLWKLLAGPSGEAAAGDDAAAGGGGSGAGAGAGAGGAGAGFGSGSGAGAPGGDEKEKAEKEEAERISAIREVKQLTQQLAYLIPSMSAHCEHFLRSWCQAGEEGRFKLACFAEAVGREMGKLPIPPDAVQDLSKVFAKMPETSIKDKRIALQKVYWDVMAAINLGPEILDQPFSYLGGVNVGMVNQVLMDQNPKLKTLVSLFMPSDLRNNYVRSQDADVKKALLSAAAEMSEIPTDELKSFDSFVKGKLTPEGNQNVVPLGLGLGKLIASLSPIDEVSLLADMRGGAFEEFKRSTPSLAFLGSWRDEELSRLLGRVQADEVVAYLRLRPELKDRFIGLCPPMTAEMVTDEIARPDGLSEKDKNQLLTAFADRLKQMVTAGEIALDQAFVAETEAAADAGSASGGDPGASAGEPNGDGGESRNAA